MGILSPSQPDLLNLFCVVVSEPQTRGCDLSRVNCNTRNCGLQHAQLRICGSATTQKCALCIQKVSVENNFLICGQEATQTFYYFYFNLLFLTFDFGIRFPPGKSRKTQPWISGKPGIFEKTLVGKSGWIWL